MEALKNNFQYNNRYSKRGPEQPKFVSVNTMGILEEKTNEGSCVGLKWNCKQKSSVSRQTYEDDGYFHRGEKRKKK